MTYNLDEQNADKDPYQGTGGEQQIAKGRLRRGFPMAEDVGDQVGNEPPWRRRDEGIGVMVDVEVELPEGSHGGVQPRGSWWG